MKKILFLLILLIVIVFGGIQLVFRGRGNNSFTDTYESFQVLYMDQELDKGKFKREDGQYYLTLDLYNELFDQQGHYDANQNAVLLDSPVGEKILPLDSDQGTINGRPIGIRDPLVEEDGEIFIPVEAIVHDFPVKMRYNPDKNVLIIDPVRASYAQATLAGDGVNLRVEPSTSSPIVSTLGGDVRLNVYGEENGWYRVREEEGFAGWIRGDNLDVTLLEDGSFVSISEEPIESRVPKALNITYDYTYGKVKEEVIQNIRQIPGLDVMIPTWFSVNEDGSIVDRGDVRYTQNYQALGIDTWGYVDNAFDPELTTKFLSNPDAMERASSDLVSLAQKYGMKGINVDFENTKISDRDGITEFVRLLSDKCREEDLILSVCVTPQISPNVEDEPYDRKSLAEIADYLIVMAYDQHWGSSDKAGSVAEYNWVEGNVSVLMRDIPKEKFILSVPFYTRVWQEGAGGLESTPVGMEAAKNYIARNNLSSEWDDKAKQLYAEGGNQKIWLENNDSIRWKASLMRKYNLAGISSWRYGFETADVWQTLQDEFGSYSYLYQ
ncbi:MAG: glycosyl hydrolase family 18 protein [Tissierellia bacterium]|nr:glycosyl hydrolase family 18 protein [Tissierellia bacterium]